jgi:hypothetical protein
MAKTRFDSLDDRHVTFIAEQEMFFVATAAPAGRVNVAPKDSASLKVMGPNRIVWVNLTGAENDDPDVVLVRTDSDDSPRLWPRQAYPPKG